MNNGIAMANLVGCVFLLFLGNGKSNEVEIANGCTENDVVTFEWASPEFNENKNGDQICFWYSKRRLKSGNNETTVKFSISLDKGLDRKIAETIVGKIERFASASGLVESELRLVHHAIDFVDAEILVNRIDESTFVVSFTPSRLGRSDSFVGMVKPGILLIDNNKVVLIRKAKIGALLN